MLERYANEMARVEKLIQKKIAWRGCVNSFAQYFATFAYAYGFYYGAYLVADKDTDFKNILKLVAV